MALIASTDVATASDVRLKAALSAAQSILPLEARLDEVEFHAKLPDRSAEHGARWERLKRESAAMRERENAAKRELKHDVIDAQPVVAGS
jgi:hypothetical protein